MREYSTLTERFFHLSMASVTSETLEKAVEAFKEYLRIQYPDFDYSSQQKWAYSLKSAEDGGPSIDKRTVNPEHVFWDQKNDKKHDPVWRLKVDSTDIIFNYRKNKLQDSGSWTEFSRLGEEMISFWQAKLNVQKWKSLDVTYFFTYGSHNVDDSKLIREDWIEVKDLLQPFAVMPHAANFKSYQPEYFWDQNWICALEENQNYLVNTRLETGRRQIQSKHENSLEIHLYLAVMPPEQLLTKKIPWTEMFEVLRDNYQALLTDYTKNSFMEDFK